MTFKVEKNIEMPFKQILYPWKEMEVGDSFKFPIENLANIRGAASYRQRTYHEKYTVRTINENTGCCWRLK